MDIKAMMKQMLTGIDNSTLDIGRILWAMGILVFFGLSIYALVHKGQTFDPIAWGTGFGCALAGGGAALGFKKGTEPPHKD